MNHEPSENGIQDHLGATIQRVKNYDSSNSIIVDMLIRCIRHCRRIRRNLVRLVYPTVFLRREKEKESVWGYRDWEAIVSDESPDLVHGAKENKKITIRKISFKNQISSLFFFTPILLRLVSVVWQIFFCISLTFCRVFLNSR